MDMEQCWLMSKMLHNKHEHYVNYGSRPFRLYCDCDVIFAFWVFYYCFFCRLFRYKYTYFNIISNGLYFSCFTFPGVSVCVFHDYLFVYTYFKFVYSDLDFNIKFIVGIRENQRLPVVGYERTSGSATGYLNNKRETN